MCEVQIDKQIKKLALKKLNALRFKTSDCHTEDIFALHSLQAILLLKDKGHECYKSYDRDGIIHIINSYL